MSPEVKEKIDSLVASNKVLVFMKGTKLMPQCGFSNNVAQILNSLGAPYETIDVLADYDVRQGIKEYSNWPTIPQVYIDGEFIGGSDIMIELYQNGKLQEMVEVALAS
ncbi:MAG: Grx4 family monothiol glutaredoxin [Leptolyngbyaceae cyanobacterium]